MFTGLVERTATVKKFAELNGNYRLTIQVGDGRELRPWRAAKIGDSVAVDGACLTLVKSTEAAAGTQLAFDVVPETLSKTSFGRLQAGACVNLERSMSAGDLFGGHYVTGHIDGVGKVHERRPEGGQILFEISAPPKLITQVLSKGSIAVDGISLTVIDVDRSEGWFSFAAIPHTMELTSLRERQRGDPVNLETDAFGKWAVHTLSDIVGAGKREEQLQRLLQAAGWTSQKPSPPGSA